MQKQKDLEGVWALKSFEPEYCSQIPKCFVSKVTFSRTNLINNTSIFQYRTEMSRNGPSCNLWDENRNFATWSWSNNEKLLFK